MSIESYKAGYIDGAAAELHYKQRCEQLEQLCRDMWMHLNIATLEQPYVVLLSEETRNEYEQRMDALGLLEGEQND